WSARSRSGAERWRRQGPGRRTGVGPAHGARARRAPRQADGSPPTVWCGPGHVKRPR
ncbi:MAG: hypothetical protein AVDCRST_MAG54-3775, partial [uncultured Actinomycetospora sp.]